MYANIREDSRAIATPSPVEMNEDLHAELQPSPLADDNLSQRTTAVLREFQEQLHRVGSNHEHGQYSAPQQVEVCQMIADMQASLSGLSARFSRDAPANERLRRQTD